MSNRYHPLGTTGSGRRFREQEESDIRSDLPIIRISKLTINDDHPRLGTDPYNHVGIDYRPKNTIKRT